MPGSEETIRLIDLPSNKADVAALIAEIKRLDEAAKGISGINIFGKTGNATDARAQQQQMAAGMQQIAELQQKMIDLEKQLAAAKEKTNSTGKGKTDEELRSQLELAEAQRKRVAGIKDQIKYDDAEIDSITRKRIELKKLQAQYDGLSATARTADVGKGMLEQIQQMDAGLKSLEGSTGRFQRNVGNYSGALKTLEEEFKKVTAAMSAMEQKGAGVQNSGARTVVQGFGGNQHSSSGPTALAGGSGLNVSVLNEDAAAYEKLATQAGYLNTIIQKNEVGFSSVTQQIRANEKALQSLRAAGMEGSEGFEQLREETTEAAREMKEFGRQQKLLESELPALKALTLAAKGLGGAYAIGSGAAALFADGNEKVEKEMNKMIAIMTILQGLEEAWTLINQAGAAAAAFRTTAVEGLSAATEVYEFVTEGATAATVALNAAMVASVIGAVIVALGGMIYLLSRATVNTKELYEAQAKLNDEMKEYYEAIIKLNESLDQELSKHDEIGKKLEEVAAVNARSIADQENISRMKRANIEADRATQAQVLDDLKKELGIRGDINGEIDNEQGLYDETMQKVQHLQELSTQYASHRAWLKSRGSGTGKEDDAIEDNERLIKVFQSQADSIKTKLDRMKEVTKAQEDSDQALAMLNAEDQKFAHEIYERKVKALTEIGNLVRQQTADYLAMQTTSPTGEGTQMKALNAEKVLREQIVNANMEQELRAEGLTGEERRLIREKANKELGDLDVNFIGREAVIRYNARNEDVNNENMTQAELLKMRQQFYQKQEQGAKNAADSQKAYLESSRDTQLQGALENHVKANPLDRNNEELRKYNELKLSIETEYNNRILRNDEELNRKQMALNRVKISDLEKQNPGTDDQKAKQQSDIANLGAANNGLIAKNADIEKQIAQNTANQTVATAKDKQARLQDIIDKSVKYEQDAQDTVQAFADAAFEREINRIDRQIKKNEELKEAETSRIQNSTMEETQKAANLERLQMETQMRNDALQRKANQVKAHQAEADRDAAVLKIFGNTLIDASAAGWITPAAIAIEVMGAAQIAALLAKSIPKYETGTDFHPGGLMMVHPGEMIVGPSGELSMTGDKASYRFGEAGTRVIPRHKTDEMNALLMASIFADNKPMQDNRLQDEIRDLRASNDRMGQNIVSAIKKQKPAQTHVHVDGNFLTYIKTCL